MLENKINLPKTNFSMKANLAQKEPIQQKKWENLDLYSKILAKNAGKQKYILHDGPPYANGNIHLGHALNKVLKDFILKFESMQNKCVPYIPGWDCHGLPIEFQLLKELEAEKKQLDQLKFRKKAASFAEKYVKLQKQDFKRLGIFGDWEHEYLTMSKDYEGESIRIFKELVKAGYIYRGLKPVYWCASCETALAEAEIEYKNHESTSVFVKFPLADKSFENTSILIWTTTPWTLPANVAVALHPDFEYSEIKIVETTNQNINQSEKFILATELLEKVVNILGVKNYEITRNFRGKDLENLKCKSPYRDELSLCILANFVTTEDGTGIVHIAPGHGEDDYLASLKYKLPIIVPVSNDGKFTVEVSQFSGKNIFEANPLIVKDLDSRKLLLKEQKIDHSYPHCWRCKNPVIFRATSQWFLNIEHNNLRSRILESCKKVNWIPEYGFNRMSSMIENRPDWCLSRQRLWGTPIPAFYCKSCGELLLTDESMSAVEKIFREKGSDTWFYVPSDEILPKTIKCQKCGDQNFEKEKDILDVWFESGVSHEVVVRNLGWPADLYLEGSDQHRGWFQSSLIPSIALYDTPPYKTVLTHGFTVDESGKKMSKSQGNSILPEDIINKFGADVLRLWIASEDYQEDMSLSENIISQMVDAYRKIRNTAKYLLGNLDGFEFAKDEIKYEDLLEIDKWILSELGNVSKKIIRAYERRDFHIVYREFYNFCSVELSSQYFDILKDRLYIFSTNSLERKSAQTALYFLVKFLAKFIAPIMPFTSEEIWESFISMENKKESIFLENFVGIDEGDKILLELWTTKNGFDLLEKWRNIFEFRKILLKKIEEIRLEKIIGNSLEARLEISLDKDCKELELLPGNSGFWSQIAIVSQTVIKIENCEQNSAISDELLPDLLKGFKVKIVAKKASGEKCSRCWNWSENIKKISDDFEICDRCFGILETWDKK